MIPKRCFAAAFAVMLLGAGSAPAIRLGRPLGEHMVLQQGVPVPIWGTANGPGDQVLVTFAGQTHRATADKDGNWMVRLPPLKAGGPFEMTIFEVTHTLRLFDVLVGEVWLASGQANMEMTVAKGDRAWGGVINEAEEVATARYPFMRMYKVKAEAAEDPETADDRQWLVTSPQTAGRYSATAYFLGREMYRTLKVPIGLIDASSVASADPRVLYQAAIAPLAPCAIRGAIWYQDQPDPPTARQYRSVMETMIKDWRRAWGQGDFPFLFAQLANYGPLAQQPEQRSGLALVREAQLQNLSVPNTGMIVTIDIGDPADPHPRNKQEVGRRLALAARALAYRESIPYSGPLYDSMTVEGRAIRLRFKHAEGGLITRGERPIGFAIAGEDRSFVWADAKIEGDTVVVSSPQVKKPVAVRYGWADSPRVNLHNQAGLPASPFRTDQW